MKIEFVRINLLLSQMGSNFSASLREDKTYDDNGRLRARKFYRSDKLEGQCEKWYENGFLFARSFYRDGKREGLCIHWRPNGRFWIQEFYQNDIPEGECKVWYNNGSLVTRKFFHYGKTNGEMKYWHANGRLLEHEYYRDDKIIDNKFSLKKKFLILKIKRRSHIQHLLPIIDFYIISDLSNNL